jgi:hypothetical protein
VRFVWWEEYDTVMLKALPLDLILSSVPVFIVTIFLNNYRLLAVVRGLLKLLCWLFDLFVVIFNDFCAFAILRFGRWTLGGQCCF